MFFLLSSLNAGFLSSRCPSQSGYSESGKTLGSTPSLRIFAPTTVVDLTSLLSVDAFGASDAPPPLEPFFAFPTANVLRPSATIISFVGIMLLKDLMWFIAISVSLQAATKMVSLCGRIICVQACKHRRDLKPVHHPQSEPKKSKLQ